MNTENVSGGRPLLGVEVRVKGHLDTDWSIRFDGLAVNHKTGGYTVLSGHLHDQPELRGLLTWLADLGLELVSVTTEAACNQIPSESDVETRSKQKNKTNAKGGTL
jgi:hypothetical protein